VKVEQLPWAETSSWFTRPFEDHVGYVAQRCDKTRCASRGTPSARSSSGSSSDAAKTTRSTGSRAMPVRRELDAIVADTMPPVLEGAGFSRRSRDFLRLADDRIVQVLSVQTSQHSTQTLVSWTYNLGVYIPDATPDASGCYLHIRLQTLCPERGGGSETWYDLGDDGFALGLRPAARGHRRRARDPFLRSHPIVAGLDRVPPRTERPGSLGVRAPRARAADRRPCVGANDLPRNRPRASGGPQLRPAPVASEPALRLTIMSPENDVRARRSRSRGMHSCIPNVRVLLPPSIAARARCRRNGRRPPRNDPVPRPHRPVPWSHQINTDDLTPHTVLNKSFSYSHAIRS